MAHVDTQVLCDIIDRQQRVHRRIPPHSSVSLRPIQHQTWQTFSRNWEVDVQQAFHWICKALLLPLAPQSTVIAMSSSASHFGSPLSGGYAAAKAAIRFISGYAADESSGAELDIRFVSVPPS